MFRLLEAKGYVRAENYCTAIIKYKGIRSSFFFLLLVDLKVPVTEAGSKIMRWIKKTNGTKKYEESVGCSAGLAV